MTSFLNAMPGALSQGIIWGIMAIGLYITYKMLDLSDLTVDGSFCTGGAVLCEFRVCITCKQFDGGFIVVHIAFAAFLSCSTL